MEESGQAGDAQLRGRRVLGTLGEHRARVYANSNCGFWMFDESSVYVELPTAELKVTRPGEIALYRRIFEDLQAEALYGTAARDLIMEVVGGLG
ncbi:hypothetical protein GCM10010123_41400 [Pilimelia anulata]|uniref:DUF5753 domain-containing protein n=2 Tax=Pilimelia anulata TaxID=53371 RepID=A0A8J3FE74_9ACTN|nr:hypothetical protein GCM10010123_41400 [Pilimelia anulata]